MEIKKMGEIFMIVFVVVVVVSLADHRAMAADLIKKHLIGRHGLCLDSDGPSRYNFPKLVPCKPEDDTQLWTFPNDGTIRWTNDRCLFPYGKKVLNQYTLVKTGQCDELQDEDKTWIFNHNNNSLVHVHSGLVLTMQNNSNFVNVEPNRNNDPSQIWYDADRHPAPRVGYIMGLHTHECLRFNPHYPILMSVPCRSSDLGINQVWALFDDGTIRANANRSLCMTSFHRSSPYYFLGVIECDGREEQLWEMNFDDDFTIHHPNSNLVIDIITIERMKEFKQKIVTLFTRNGDSTQKWTFIE